jgi:TRAP-type C4-dicarboxylate transport system permease small subunit
MRRAIDICGGLFGWMFLLLALLVSAEVVMRKALNISMQGADELGGYALAVGSSLAFTIALVDRAHVRIDLLHDHLPPRVQGLLNWLAALLLAAFALLLVWVCWPVIVDTLDYRSTAATPWATPLIWPQSVWFAALVVFALAALGLAVRATRLLAAGDVVRLNAAFHPKGAIEELEEELADLERR